MLFMYMIYNIAVDGWLVMIAVFACLVFVFYRFAREDSSVSASSRKPYACGLSVSSSDDRVPSASFYKTIISVFRLSVIKKMHANSISSYLLWMLVGVVGVLAYFILLA